MFFLLNFCLFGVLLQKKHIKTEIWVAALNNFLLDCHSVVKLFYYLVFTFLKKSIQQLSQYSLREHHSNIWGPLSPTNFSFHMFSQFHVFRVKILENSFAKKCRKKNNATSQQQPEKQTLEPLYYKTFSDFSDFRNQPITGVKLWLKS